MFERIEFKGLKKSDLFGYAAEVDFFKKRKGLAFKPGLNILFGPNGCGKSTVLNILGTTMCAVQGGVSVVTEDIVHQSVDWGTLRPGKVPRPMRDKVGLKVVHDGQPVLFADPRKAIGLVGGAFDNDFMQAGVLELTERRKASHGQASLGRLGNALGVLRNELEMPKAVQYAIQKKHVNSRWVEAIEVLEARMAGSVPAGQPTLLLDEPEANFSLRWQATLWKLLAESSAAERLQVIVATHSPFAVGIAHANYIDMGEEGYRAEIEQLLRERFGSPAASAA